MPGKKRGAAPAGRRFFKEWRDKSGLSQAKVAAAIDMEQSSYQKIEAKKVPYNEIVVDALARLYGCSQADLLSTNPLAGGERAVNWTHAGIRLDIIRRAFAPELAAALVPPGETWEHYVNSFSGDVLSDVALQVYAATKLPLRFIISGDTDELSKVQLSALLEVAMNNSPD